MHAHVTFCELNTCFMNANYNLLIVCGGHSCFHTYTKKHYLSQKRIQFFLCMHIVLVDHTSVCRPPGLAGKTTYFLVNGFAQVWRVNKYYILKMGLPKSGRRTQQIYKKLRWVRPGLAGEKGQILKMGLPTSGQRKQEIVKKCLPGSGGRK